MEGVSVLIPVLNEAVLIKRIIESVSWADEVLVMDSGSTDDTIKLAREAGARVVEMRWNGWGKQMNLGAEDATNDWVLAMDADELITKELAQSIMSAMSSNPDPKDGYVMDRRHDFLGKILPNESRAVKRRNFVRLYNRRVSKFDDDMSVHEEVRFPGEAIELSGYLLHWRGSDFDELVGVFNKYATIESDLLHKNGQTVSAFGVLLRTLARFTWSYAIKGGWRLGGHGLIHSMLKASSDYMRYAKLWEKTHGTEAIDPPKAVYQPYESGGARSVQSQDVLRPTPPA